MIEIKGGTIGSKRDFLGEFFGRLAWPYDPLGRIGSCPGSQEACLPLGRTERVTDLELEAIVTDPL